jgi:hypothetical protein
MSRCFACDRQHPSHNDGETGRDYCSTCWNVIEETIGRQREEDMEEEPSFLLTFDEEHGTMYVKEYEHGDQDPSDMP